MNKYVKCVEHVEQKKQNKYRECRTHLLIEKERDREMRQIFNLSLETDVLEELRRAAAREQLTSGQKVSVTGIITELIEEYLKESLRNKAKEDKPHEGK